MTLRKCGLWQERRDRWGGKKGSFGKSLVLNAAPDELGPLRSGMVTKLLGLLLGEFEGCVVA